MAHKINVQLPIQLEDFYVLSFGKIITSPLYYGANYIWPIGYKSCWHEKLTGSLFTCEVSNNGQGGPLFTITRSSCSESTIQYGQTIMCRADLDEHDNVVTELTEMTKIDPGSGDEVGYEDVIGDLYVEWSSTSSTWKLLLENIVDVHKEFINQTGAVQCYCRHAEDLITFYHLFILRTRLPSHAIATFFRYVSSYVVLKNCLSYEEFENNLLAPRPVTY
ncbi:unnamed protein product [Lactuca saligna]|uniref:Uncharacterized protein n=1 Tax=Lactuca saligna TaxID=75948 RepID=A0AA35VI09_LACSI|nr:unnamed protein product [Lactuca saligna]